MHKEQELRQFEIPNTLVFVKNDNGLTKIIIKNALAEAEIFLHGGLLTHFQPIGEEALIFDAKESRVTPPKSVHAGIPICWPWFGAHPTDSSKPQHGFARDRVWRVKSTQMLDTEETEIVLVLNEDKESLALFCYAFELELTFTIGRTLSIALKTTNTDRESFTITQALHTYFAISDIETIRIGGVEETPFIDYTDDKKEKKETEALQIHQEVNRVYVPTDASCTIVDKGLGRKIVIDKKGSNSTTIWNPWRESGLHDLPGKKYRKFVCIETTNALQDAVTLQADESHQIIQTISLS